MRKAMQLSALLLLATLSTFAQTYSVPPSKHVVVVALENASYSEVTSTSMPWLTSIAAKNGLMTQFYATTHPSIGNYFSVSMGQIVTNNDASTATRSEDNIVRHMLGAGLTWKSYAESLPSVGYTGGDVYPYVLHHNPFAYFSDVRNSSSEKLNLVPFTQFATDIANNALPNFTFIVPNQYHNAHDCPQGMSSCTKTQKLQAADSWMKSNLASLLATPAFQPGGDGILYIWFDESNTNDTAYGGGHIYVAAIGPTVRAGHTGSTHYNHYSLLRSIMESLGMTTFPANAATANDLKYMFKPTSGTSTGGSNTVTITSPTNNSTVNSPVTVSASATSAAPYTVRGMAIYLDGAKVYSTAASSFTTSLAMTAGATHRLTVQASNTSGAYYQTVYYVTVASSTSSHSVSLKWQASAGTSITYKVYRGAKSGGPYALVKSSLATPAYTDTAVTSGAAYYYVVTALSGTKESAFSNEAKALIP